MNVRNAILFLGINYMLLANDRKQKKRRIGMKKTFRPKNRLNLE